MTGSTVEITTADGVADAYLARPDGVSAAPAVIIHSDAFGRRPAVEELADRLAVAGYAALVPNVYYRTGSDPVGALPAVVDLTEWPELRDRVGPLMRSLDRDTTARDAAAYLEFLAADPGVTDGPVATVGYCMGARLGLWAAAAQPSRIAAVAGFHGGGLATDAPDSPHRGVGALRAEVYLGHADHDQGMPPEQIRRLDDALDEAGVRHRTEVYPDAPHGFAVSDLGAYRPDAAARHFVALVDLLDRTIGPGAPGAS